MDSDSGHSSEIDRIGQENVQEEIEDEVTT